MPRVAWRVFTETSIIDREITTLNCVVDLPRFRDVADGIGAGRGAHRRSDTREFSGTPLADPLCPRAFTRKKTGV